MSGHDATSVVGQMAGLNVDQPKPSAVTPDQLAARFCADVEEGLVARAHGWRDEDGHKVARGFCGYIGGRGDSMVTGFDDGYDFMGYLEEHGWVPLPRKGDWPYVVYLAYGPREPYAIAAYCEADFTIWTFDSGQDAQEFYRRLKQTP